MSIPGTYSSMLMSTSSSGIQYVGDGGRILSNVPGSLSFPVPSGAIAGDYLIIAMEYSNGVNSATPSGWTQLAYRLQGSVIQLKLIGRFYDGSTTPSVSWSILAGSTKHIIGTCIALRGVNTTTPLDRAAEEDNISLGPGTNIMTNNHSQTTLVPNCYFLNMLAYQENTSTSTNFSDWACSSIVDMNELFEASTSTGTHGGLALAGGIKVNAGSLASTTFTKASSDTKDGGYFALAFRPAT